MTDSASPQSFDLVIVGGTPAGLSVAIDAASSGLGSVRVLEPDVAVAVPELVGAERIDVSYQERLTAVNALDDALEITTEHGVYRTRALLIADQAEVAAPTIPTAGLATVHVGAIPAEARDADVLVIGSGETAVDRTCDLVARGARVVLAAAGMKRELLSRESFKALSRLESERTATLLWHSVPSEVADVDGLPMAYFSDRRTPDLQFDHVVFAGDAAPDLPARGIDASVVGTGRVWSVGDVGDHSAPAGAVWASMSRALFPEVEPPPLPVPTDPRLDDEVLIAELEAEYYNATITQFEPTHSDLWVLRIRPDNGDVSHLPGQYASLGLGYWEPRIDPYLDDDFDERWDKLIRRSYSISSPMFDEHGYLTSSTELGELEFYIVLVPADDTRVPALTPRLARKTVGDRIYMGGKVAGRYTLAPVTNPEAEVVFLSTGTGEAPHNAMVTQLLRKGHTGPIVSAVSVRQSADLGYEQKHRTLEQRYPNYHYLPLPTREPDIPKRYIQDVLANGELEAALGAPLNAESTHVFLCGNPAMIGLPEGDDGAFPETTGAVEILMGRGFSLDTRKQRGNIHFEEYW